MPDRTALIVLGMHRSGTSALAGMLHLLGAGKPADLMPADEFNEKGYWESKEAADFNDEIFKSAGTKWDHIGRFPTEWFKKPQTDDFRRRAAELLHKTFGDSPLFVLKDPRTSLLVPFWQSVLKEMRIRPIFVLTARNPKEVADSLAHRDHFPAPKSMLLWLIHLLEAERSTRGLPRCLVAYDMLLDDWRRCARRVSQAMTSPWPKSIDQAAPEIEALLSKSLRHHRATMDDLAQDPGVVEWVKRAYAEFLTAAEVDQSSLAKTLDEIAASLDDALLAFGPLLSVYPSEKARITDSQRSEKRAQAERAAIAKLKQNPPPVAPLGLDQLSQLPGYPRFLALVDMPAGKWRVRATVRSSVWSLAAICLDSGRGFIDCESTELAPIAPGENAIDRVIEVLLPTSMIRLDPIQDPGDFSLIDFSLEPHQPPSDAKPGIRDLWRRLRAQRAP
ncbi:MAG: hypothetical protein ABSF29_10600 [Tepidisphaeraceae bacterium]|jgi:hypothetical protein